MLKNVFSICKERFQKKRFPHFILYFVFRINYKFISIWAAIVDYWSTIDHFAKVVDVIEFVVDITLKWLIFHQNIPEQR